MEGHDAAVIIVGLLALGVAAQWVAWRTRVPAIVLLSVAGLVVGPLTPGRFLDPAMVTGEVAQIFVTLGVAVILFEGGLSLERAELKVAAAGVRRLVWLGAPLAWFTCSLAAHYVGGLGWPVALVFGAIMVVTGPTVIMPLLRQAALNRRTASYLKWEGIVNDPIGALLAVLVFQFFVFSATGVAPQRVVVDLLMAVAAAAVLGTGVGWLTGRAFLAGLVPEFLKSPVMLTLVMIVYEISNAIQAEAGLLAVTVMGIVIGNMNLPGLEDMRRFKEYITVVLVSLVFVVLTAGLQPGSFAGLELRGLLLVVVVMFVARPVTVWLATAGAGMDRRDRALLAWIAPRGIVAAATAGVMGPGLVAAGYPEGDRLLPLVFAVIFATVIAHGFSLGWLSRRLGLSSPTRDGVLLVGASPWTVELGRTLEALGAKVIVADRSWHALRAARLAGLKVFYGEILSEFAEESVEVAHVQTVLAATDNDAYNALVCTALAPEIGRDRVFQLAMGEEKEADPRAVAGGLKGRVAFDSRAEYEYLWERAVEGWEFSRTKLSETYTYSDFLGDLPGRALQLAVVRDEGSRVILLASASELEPEAGDALVYFAPPREAERTAPAATGSA
jgi:NhaP-type Na+/H+ or K+/H+ antiporter